MSHSKNLSPSELATLKQVARWRLLLRNGKFQEEFNALRSRAPALPMYWKDDEPFSLKWGVGVRDLLQDKSLPPLSREGIAFYESLSERVSFGSGVTIWDAYEPSYADVEGVLYSWDWEPPEERGQKFILEVDLSVCKLDLALRMIETHLRRVVSEARAETLQRKKTIGANTIKQKRDRVDKLDFQLKVFDMAQDFYNKKNRKFFQFVAVNLQAKPSTVKSAYWAVCYKIGVEGSRERTRTEAPPEAPCPFDKCEDPKCRQAQTGTDLDLMVQGLCQQHKAIWQKTQPTLRESVGHDLSRIEHAKKKRETGRRYVKRSTDSAE